MAIELEITCKKFKTRNKIKFKYEAAKAINEKSTNYKHICAFIVFGKNSPITENQIHNKIEQNTG